MPDTHRRHSLAIVWAVARTEYIRWATDPRMILLPVLLVFLYQSAVDPLLQMAAQMQAPLHWLEPFVGGDKLALLMLFLPLVFLMLLGDFPRTDGCALFMLYRVGRLRWLQGQLLFALLAMLSFLACTAAGVTLPAIGQLAWRHQLERNGTAVHPHVPGAVAEFCRRVDPRTAVQPDAAGRCAGAQLPCCNCCIFKF